MVRVPSARRYGFDLYLNEDVMRDVLNGTAVTSLVAQAGEETRAAVESHVRATASPESADNYVGALFVDHADSNLYGFDFGGQYGLGNRPTAVIGVPSGRGPNPDAKPPLMVEAETHALTSVPGFTAGTPGEDIR